MESLCRQPTDTPRTIPDCVVESVLVQPTALAHMRV
jgi:hypothetical protein